MGKAILSWCFLHWFINYKSITYIEIRQFRLFTEWGWAICVCMFARTAITTHHVLGGINSWNLFSQDSGGWKCRTGLAGLFMLSPLCLACRWPSSLSVLTWLSFGFVVCVLISSYRDTSHIRLGSTHITLFYLNCFLKGPLSK